MRVVLEQQLLKTLRQRIALIKNCSPAPFESEEQARKALESEERRVDMSSPDFLFFSPMRNCSCFLAQSERERERAPIHRCSNCREENDTYL